MNSEVNVSEQNQSTRKLPRELANLTVNTQVRERILDVSIQFESVSGDRGKILWYASNEKNSVDCIMNDERFFSVRVTDDYDRPEVVVSQDRQLSERLAELSQLFASAAAAALEDTELSQTLRLGADGTSTTLSLCESGCKAAGAQAGKVIGDVLAGACTGASGGFAAPACTIGGRLAGVAAGVLLGEGCSWLFC